jgi:hypothetical protein
MGIDVILISIVTGIIASFSSFLLMWLVKPRIKIAKCIAKAKDGTETIYTIKLINKTPVALFDLNYDLVLRIPMPNILPDKSAVNDHKL